jgi:hypothetical protein
LHIDRRSSTGQSHVQTQSGRALREHYDYFIHHSLSVPREGPLGFPFMNLHQVLHLY